jgi:ankyrin repeat protein
VMPVHLPALVCFHIARVSFFPFDLISDQTPLHKSARNGHADLCQMLLLAGCDVNAKSVLNMYSSICARVRCCAPHHFVFLSATALLFTMPL